MKRTAAWHIVTAGDKQNPPLLFVHGFMGAASDWDDVVAGLSSEYYCISIDLPGHGKTPMAGEKEYGMEKCAADLVGMLDEMGVGKCGVIGYSMGGRLAFFLAVDHPGRFDKVVVESGSPGLKTEMQRQQRVEQDRQLAERISGEPIATFLESWYNQPLFDGIDKSSPTFEKMINTRAQNNPAGLAWSLEVMGTGAQPSLWPRLGAIKRPMLLIVGERDTKFTSIATDVAGQCPTAEIAVVADAGHNVHLENPEEYVKQVRLFFQT